MKPACANLLSTGARTRRSRWGVRNQASPDLRGDLIMTKSLIASIVALSFVASVAASAIAHPQPQTSVQKPFPPKDFWDQQRINGE